MFNISFGYILERGYQGIDNIEGKLRNMFLAMETGNLDRLLKGVNEAIDRCDAREKAAGIDRKVLMPEDLQ